MYGGNCRGRHLCIGSQGLSPYVRGKLYLTASVFVPPRSIPVCTGETNDLVAATVRAGVYPRMYGGNYSINIAPSCSRGLSPYVRGKPLGMTVLSMVFRSIPVCTGETLAGCNWRTCFVVYPRMYGGNPTENPIGTSNRGLSPYVRGKLIPNS